MIKKPTPPENNEKTYPRDKVFARFYGEVNYKGSGVTVHHSITPQAQDNNTIKATISQEISTKTVQESNSNNQSLKDPSVNNREQNKMLRNLAHISVLEMWIVIEGVGIKRQDVVRTFSTDDATSELYYVVEHRLHYNREQEMIKRLTEYTAKTRKVDSDKNRLYA